MIKVGAVTNARLIKALIPGDMSCQELAEETGLHYVTVLEYCREMHKVGAVHISAWENDARGRAVVKIFKLGSGPDARRLSRKQLAARRAERYRARKRLAAQLNLKGNHHAPAQAA